MTAQETSPRDDASRATVVAETVNCEVVLTPRGFYARCTKCPWVSEYTASKSVARRWANEHDAA